MATWQAVNILSGTTEPPKYNIGNTTVIWKAALTTALANGDTILGPVIPAGTFLIGVEVDVTNLDSASGITFECGILGSLGKFIATGNTTARAGGIAAANTAGTKGYLAVANTQVLVTITAAATTPVAGTMVIQVSYTAAP